VKSVAIVAASDFFPQANAVALVKAAQDAGIRVTDQETLDKNTADFAAVLEKLKATAPDQVVTVLGPYTAAFFKAYEASGWKVPLTGRIDFVGYDRHRRVYARAADAGHTGIRRGVPRTLRTGADAAIVLRL
jgi:hypothetical protein